METLDETLNGKEIYEQKVREYILLRGELSPKWQDWLIHIASDIHFQNGLISWNKLSPWKKRLVSSRLGDFDDGNTHVLSVLTTQEWAMFFSSRVGGIFAKNSPENAHENSDGTTLE